MIRNVLFDWSGTLVDDLSAVWRATNFTFTQSGRAEMSLEEFREEFSLPFDQFYERVTPAVPLAQLEEWYKQSFAHEQKTIKPLPHARAFFDFCKSNGLRTFLLSTIHPDHYREQSARIPFAFDHAYVRVMDKCEGIPKIIDEQRLRVDETIFIGDMQHDVEAARAGGVHSCAVLTGYNCRAQLEEAEPEIIVEHLGQLQQLLERSQLEWPVSENLAIHE